MQYFVSFGIKIPFISPDFSVGVMRDKNLMDYRMDIPTYTYCNFFWKKGRFGKKY